MSHDTSRLLKRLTDQSPIIMGVLNVTPDSFADGGELWASGQLMKDKALRQVESMLAEGAEIIDIGGESTRPGAQPVSVEEELERVVPLIELLIDEFACAISIDTSNPQVMRATADAGVSLINDVRALQRDGAIEAAAATGLPVCLMHMQGEPETMQDNPEYDDVLGSVKAFLMQRIEACEAQGIPRERIVLDPGFGFGKTVQQNYTLFRHLPDLAENGLPILVGVSRKSMIGAVIDRPVGQRIVGSVVLAALAVERGARIVRVHDVAETADALRLLSVVEANTVAH